MIKEEAWEAHTNSTNDAGTTSVSGRGGAGVEAREPLKSGGSLLVEDHRE